MGEGAASTENNIHSSREIDNYIATSELLNGWVNSDWPSSYFVPPIHKQLLLGIEDYQKKGLMRVSPGEFRKKDIWVSGEPENFYVRGTDVEPVVREFFRDLDSSIASRPEKASGNLKQIVHTAAWAYYVFERIHPFFDGNGRTGRIILNRVLRGSGLDGIIFLDTWFNQERENHLDAMNLVDKTGDLAPLELYLLHSLSTNINNLYLKGEIDSLITEKEDVLLKSTTPKNIGNIWQPFSKIDLASADAAIPEPVVDRYLI